jgi:hypothetical protein
VGKFEKQGLRREGIWRDLRKLFKEETIPERLAKISE